MSDYLTGPWTAFMATVKKIHTELPVEYDSDVDFCLCRGEAMPEVGSGGALDWPVIYRADDQIDLWQDVKPDEVERRWVQAQAMAAGLNAAAEAVNRR